MDKSKADSSSSRIRPGLVLAVMAILGVLIAGKFLGWYGGTPHPPETGEEIVATEPTPPEVVPPTTGTKPARITPGQPATPNAPGTIALAPAAPPTPAEMLKPGEWEQRLDDILGGDEAEPFKAQKLLDMFPLLPPDAQVEVAQHLSNLLADDRYPELAKTFTNPKTSEEVLEVLMTDVLNRGNALKLPTLLEVARTEGHPKSEEARDVLEVFVDENYGTDWAKWEKAIQDWLKENPDEEPEPEEKEMEVPVK